MENLDDFFKSIEKDFISLTKDEYSKYESEILSCYKGFMNKINDDLKNWSIAFSNGDITQEEFDSLIRGKKDFLEIETLQKIGEGKIRIDNLLNSITGLIVKNLIKII